VMPLENCRTACLAAMSPFIHLAVIDPNNQRRTCRL
jgi:hypothetical protein